MAKLHDDLAAYLWRVQGPAALGIVSAHYARGGDPRGFAAGVPRLWQISGPKTVHAAGGAVLASRCRLRRAPCRRALRSSCSDAAWACRSCLIAVCAMFKEYTVAPGLCHAWPTRERSSSVEPTMG